MNKLLRRMNLFQRLLLYFLIVILIPLFLVTSITYSLASQAIQKQLEIYLDDMTNNIYIQVERFVEKYERITLPLVLEAITNDSQLHHFLQGDYSGEMDRYQNYQALHESMNIINTQNPDVDLLYIISDYGRVILSEDRYFSPNEPFPIQDVYEELSTVTPNSGEAVIHSWQSANNSNVITIARKLKGVDFQHKGILGINIKVNELVNLWSDLNLGTNSYFMIIDQTGKIIYHPDHQKYGHNVPQSIEQALNVKQQGSFF